MITLKKKEWHLIKKQIQQDFQDTPSVWLLRSTMKKVLGFTIREGTSWNVKHGYRNRVYLDFFDEAKETYFILKYL
jgi:hypothetical protein